MSDEAPWHREALCSPDRHLLLAALDGIARAAWAEREDREQRRFEAICARELRGDLD